MSNEVQLYKVLKPSLSDKFAELNNNAFRLVLTGKYIGDISPEQAFAKSNIIQGRYVEKEEKQRAGTLIGDLAEQYKRLKYSAKAMREFEAELDDEALSIRTAIVSGEITKRAGIDRCWLTKKYSHKQIMYITLSYYSTVYERRVVIENENK